MTSMGEGDVVSVDWRRLTADMLPVGTEGTIGGVRFRVTEVRRSESGARTLIVTRVDPLPLPVGATAVAPSERDGDDRAGGGDGPA